MPPALSHPFLLFSSHIKSSLHLISLDLPSFFTALNSKVSTILQVQFACSLMQIWTSQCRTPVYIHTKTEVVIYFSNRGKKSNRQTWHDSIWISEMICDGWGLHLSTQPQKRLQGFVSWNEFGHMHQLLRAVQILDVSQSGRIVSPNTQFMFMQQIICCSRVSASSLMWTLQGTNHS